MVNKGPYDWQGVAITGAIGGVLLIAIAWYLGAFTMAT
jgi:hypothetical protein